MLVTRESWQKSEGRERNSLTRVKWLFIKLRLPPSRIPNIPGGAGNTTRLLRFTLRCIESSLRIHWLSWVW